MAVLWIVVKDVGKIILKYSSVGQSKFGLHFLAVNLSVYKL